MGFQSLNLNVQKLYHYYYYYTPQAYDSARALRLCGPSTHCYYTENRALWPDEKLHTPVGVPSSCLLTSLRLLFSRKQQG